MLRYYHGLLFKRPKVGRDMRNAMMQTSSLPIVQNFLVDSVVSVQIFGRCMRKFGWLEMILLLKPWSTKHSLPTDRTGTWIIFPLLLIFLGLKNSSNIEEKDKNNEEETKQLYEKVAFLVSREQMVQHVEKFDDHFITEMGSKYGRALRIMEPAAKVRRKSQTSKRAELNETTIEWLEDQWFERMAPVTGHATYDEFATELSEFLFTDVDVIEDILEEEKDEKGGKESIGVHVLGKQKQQKQSKKSSIVIGKQSSISVRQMPGIRRRRESLAPHE
jgi:hypothetical protein